ncbi:MAG: hypothetical protein ORN98_02780 [Alphaproteobacteria bacterium]|nr:hypothetical protein [Alphaproteobacteria bacterium]
MIMLNLPAETEAKLSALAVLNGQTIEEAACDMINLSLSDSEPTREFRPNAKTLRAMTEGMEGKFEGKAHSVDEFLAELNRDE